MILLMLMFSLWERCNSYSCNNITLNMQWCFCILWLRSKAATSRLTLISFDHDELQGLAHRYTNQTVRSEVAVFYKACLGYYHLFIRPSGSYRTE